MSKFESSKLIILYNWQSTFVQFEYLVNFKENVFGEALC